MFGGWFIFIRSLGARGVPSPPNFLLQNVASLGDEVALGLNSGTSVRLLGFVKPRDS